VSDAPKQDEPKQLLLCLLGTDHHLFGRLVGWCDALASRRPDIDVLVQHGYSQGPAVADGVSFLDKQALTETLARAHVAITHGGPGLISDVRNAGLAPLVVARDPGLGEHVDGHQQRFVARVAASGIVRALSSQEELIDEVEKQLSQARGSSVDRAEDEQRVATAVARFAALVEPLRRAAR
jgi:UDP-N-acetylglucosamine transferase subunit ALG13